jgi:hypothetical protein
MDNEPKANLEPDRGRDAGTSPPVVCVHCGADSNRRTGKPFNQYSILAHLKSCPKRGNPAQDSAAGTCAGKNDDSPAQGVNQDNNILRRKRGNPASLSHSMRIEKKAGGRKEESDDYNKPSLAYRRLMPPEKNPGDNDPINLPLVMSAKDAAYVLALFGHVLSPIEHSVTRMYIKGRHLTEGQEDVLDAALIELKNAEDDHKQWEEKMKNARMTPEERKAASDAETAERKRRADEVQAAATIQWTADLAKIEERERTIVRCEEHDSCEGGPCTFGQPKPIEPAPKPAPAPDPKEVEADRRVAEGLAREIAEANEYRKAKGLPLLGDASVRDEHPAQTLEVRPGVEAV